MLHSVELVTCDGRYERNHIAGPGLLQNDLTRIQNCNCKTVDDLTTAL